MAINRIKEEYNTDDTMLSIVKRNVQTALWECVDNIIDDLPYSRLKVDEILNSRKGRELARSISLELTQILDNSI